MVARFLFDFNLLEHLLENLPLRGIKGTTGTQASFLELFNHDHDKVKKLDSIIASKLGFKRTVPLSGQTYTRKLDYQTIVAAVPDRAISLQNGRRYPSTGELEGNRGTFWEQTNCTLLFAM